jgi:tryptophanyl-tRNA synthetase
MPTETKIILTGDRPTGRLHLGHYLGSLMARVRLQTTYRQFILLADMQALTDNAENPTLVRDNVVQVVCDYLAAGINPHQSTIVLQSGVPEIAELFMYLSNLVSVARVERNPTVKDEIRQKGMGESVPFGFFAYPVSQAADITAFHADLVPVGADQKPMIELTNEIVRRFNTTYNSIALREVEALIPEVGRLPGIDGKAKMSKTLRNTIALDATNDEIAYAVKMMFTDPHHLRVDDPGKVEGNVVFTYLDGFDPDKATLEHLKDRYRRGGLGDSVIKKRLTEILIALISPMRRRRNEVSSDPASIVKVIRDGTDIGRAVAGDVLDEVKSAMKINYNSYWRSKGWLF